MTSYYKKSVIALTILHYFLLLSPLIGFSIYAFATSTTESKVVLGLVGTCGIALGCISVISHYTFRGSIWLILLGLGYAVDFAKTTLTLIILIFAITTIIDEIIIEPLRKKYKEKLSINIEIDKRS